MSERAFYLFSAIDAQNVFQCFWEDAAAVPFAIDVKPGLPVPAQLVDDVLQRFPDLRRVHVHWVPFIAEAIDAESKLYLLLYEKIYDHPSGQLWPDLLKKLPQDRRRLAFLKAFQVVMGLHKENVKALHADDLRSVSPKLDS